MLSVRDQFCVPESGPYLLAHSVGCLPRAGAEAFQSRFLQPWIEKGGDAWPTWLESLDEFRAALAALLGGSAAEYCPELNVSAALSRLLGALPPPTNGRRVWIAAEDSFPSIGFVLQRASRLGYEVRFIPKQHSPGQLATWEQALTPDVCGVLVTHVHSNTGVLAPVEGIARLCRERQALSVIDVCQSAGIIPFSVEGFGADILIGSCVKWLCGGPGAGFLWVRNELLPKLEPIDVGWFSHANPFEFDIHSFVPAPDARRFLGGTPSPAPFTMAAASLRTIAKLSVAAIREHNRALSDAFLKGIPDDWRQRLPREETGGTLCISTGDAHQDVTNALRAGKVSFDTRGSIVRLSFHAYNTLEDAQNAARAFSQARR